MAVSKTILPGSFGSNSSKLTGANNTAVAIATSSSVIYVVELDNTANSADSFAKFYNLAAGSTTVGSDAPDMVLKAPATKKVTYHFSQGVTLDTAVSLACVTLAGTAGNSSPTSNVTIKIIYT
jgi:hypothetical protein|tara:strand:+ start:186 stop:554 length:369 start_codon:yes stop_codon:yes gene_type:complete